MRDPERIDDVLAELEEYWKEHPDLRLAQIIGNISQARGHGRDPYHMEDDEVLETLKKHNEG